MQLKSSDVLLAAMAAGGHEAEYTPVQIQKLMFVVDREIPSLVDGPHFAFKPDAFGPFDEGVYETIRDLADRNMVRIDSSTASPIYSLYDDSFEQGYSILVRMPELASRFIQGAASWIRMQTFRQLVISINSIYPDMAVKSTAFHWMEYMRSFQLTDFGLFLNRTPSQSFGRGFLRVMDGLDDGSDVAKRSQWLQVLSSYWLGGPSLGEIWMDVGEDLRSAMQDYAAGLEREPQ